MRNDPDTKQLRWDLGVMYQSIDDPALDADIAEFEERAKAFHASHKGKLAATLSRAIRDFSAITMLGNKVEGYVFLLQSTDVTDPAVKAKLAEVNTRLSRAQADHLTFFELEVVALSGEVLDMQCANGPVVAKHRPWIEHLSVFKPHMLKGPVEAALTKRSPFGPRAWGEFFDELEADLAFPFRGEIKTLPEMLHVLEESKDAHERAEALGRIDEGLKGPFVKYAAQTLFMVAGSKAVELRERGYRHPMEARNKSNRVSDEVVEALHAAVRDIASPLARRYYRLKAAHLGMKTLRWSDRNAPMPFRDTTTVPFDEAMAIVVEAYGSFSPTLAGLVREFVNEKRIDVPAAKGKRGGAFNATLVLPGGEPVSFTLLNYLGSNRDVMVLAHELGHGVHGMLAGRAQGPLMFQAPTAYAETASIFGEVTTFNFLKDRLFREGNQASLLALLMGKIDDAVNTVVRQIAFSNFERRLHGMDTAYRTWGEPKRLSVEELNALWLETTAQLYGNEGDVFTYENAAHLWSYVSHFHRPFYVYGYAFGELLTQSLYVQRARLGGCFEPLYLDLLRSGSTKGVTELLEPFGLDPSGTEFWADGIAAGLGALVTEAEELSRAMGILQDKKETYG